MDAVEVKLPKWQSHKIVQADKVIRVEQRPFAEQVIADDTFLTWHTAHGSIFVSHELRRRGGDNPVGGYVVIYADGFVSWSPAKAFEEGYTLVE